MSTRSNIAIKLRESDVNKTFVTPWGEEISPNGAPYLYVYCHFDGYPEGVGVNLAKRFHDKTYEDALKYILEGDRSTSYLSYYEKMDDGCGPYPAKTIKNMFENEYLYIIEEIDGKLHVNVHYIDGGIADLTEEFCYEEYTNR